jgi:hypothetical protein
VDGSGVEAPPRITPGIVVGATAEVLQLSDSNPVAGVPEFARMIEVNVVPFDPLKFR